MIMFQDNCTNWQQQSYFLLLIIKIVSVYTDSTSSLVLHVVQRSEEEHYNTSDQLIIEAVLVINGTIGRLP